MHSPQECLQRLICCALLLAAVCGFLAAPSFAAPQVLYRFRGDDGASPSYGNLILDGSGNLYGITYYGGDYAGGCSYGCGTVFKLGQINGKWTHTVLHEFLNDGKDGYYPLRALVADAAGNLYGTTTEGGANHAGTVFRLTPSAEGSYN